MSVPRSYIISQYKVSKTTHDFVHAKLQGLDPEHRRFFLHILCSQLLELRKERSKWCRAGTRSGSISRS